MNVLHAELGSSLEHFVDANVFFCGCEEKFGVDRGCILLPNLFRDGLPFLNIVVIDFGAYHDFDAVFVPVLFYLPGPELEPVKTFVVCHAVD